MILPALMAGPGWGQSAEDAAARQRRAAAAMQESLAKQQASVQQQASGQQQMATASGGSFFALPRAASLGGVNGALPGSSPGSFAPPIMLACDPLPAPEVDSLVGVAAQRDGVSPDLLRGVMKQESGFRPCAVSSKGAMGLMQLMPGTAEQFGLSDPFDAASNVDAGARFLKQLLTKYSGDLPKTLGAYNAGPAKVDAAGAVPAIPETMEYVRLILSALPFREERELEIPK
jgi:soluble lytic murein transglycosylase-like protein